jgi:hypothetical protein
MLQGKFKIIRTDGTEEIFNLKPTIQRVKLAIGAVTIDTVMIGKNPANGPPETVMIVDDIGTGFIGVERVGPTKPVNEKATVLYHSVCRSGTPHQIHGDVAICNDRDFG